MVQCFKALFPLIKMDKELSGAAGLPLEGPPQIRITLHEDNSGALILAKPIPPESLQGENSMHWRLSGLESKLWWLVSKLLKLIPSYSGVTSAQKCHQLSPSSFWEIWLWDGNYSFYCIGLCVPWTCPKMYKVFKAWEGVLICGNRESIFYTTLAW